MKHIYLKCLFLGILTLFSINVSAFDCNVDGIYYNLNKTDKTASVTYYNYSSNRSAYTGSVTIPPSITYNGTNYSVTSIGDEAFYDCSGLTSINIPNSVTYIGSHAFSLCGLTSITIPNSVTTIEAYAFENCCYHDTSSSENYESDPQIISPPSGGLTSIIIGNSVTSIGEDAFSGCYFLKSVTINSNAILSQTYSSNSSLKDIFGSQVGNYILGDEVTSIGDYAFYNTHTSEWDYYNNNLHSIDIPNSVKTIGKHAFSSNYLLSSIDIPNGVTSIGECAFCDCYGLTSVIIPNSVTSIGNNAFFGCNSLESVTSYITDVFETGYGAFYEVATDATLYVPKGLVETYRATADWNMLTNIVEMSEAKKGDVNDDGNVDISDVVALVNHILDNSSSASFNSTAADLNNDGNIDISDVVSLVNSILGQ